MVSLTEGAGSIPGQKTEIPVAQKTKKMGSVFPEDLHEWEKRMGCKRK